MPQLAARSKRVRTELPAGRGWWTAADPPASGRSGSPGVDTRPGRTRRQRCAGRGTASQASRDGSEVRAASGIVSSTQARAATRPPRTVRPRRPTRTSSAAQAEAAAAREADPAVSDPTVRPGRTGTAAPPALAPAGRAGSGREESARTGRGSPIPARTERSRHPGRGLRPGSIPSRAGAATSSAGNERLRRSVPDGFRSVLPTDRPRFRAGSGSPRTGMIARERAAKLARSACPRRHHGSKLLEPSGRKCTFGGTLEGG